MNRILRIACFVALVWTPFSGARANPSEYTLIVAPARYSVLQVAFDVVAREPAVLVSYQGEGSTPDPLLHAWNGQEWVNVSMQDFREVSFLEKMPTRTILIGDDKTLPASLVDAASWSPEILHARSLGTADLVNELGRDFKWRTSDWKWFAKRYGLDLADESAPQRNSSWYDQPGPLYRPPLGDAIRERPAPSYEPPAAPVFESETESTEAADASEKFSSKGWSMPAAAADADELAP